MSTVRIVVLAALGLLVLSGTAFALTEALRSESDSRFTVTEQVHRIVVRSDAGSVDVRAGLTADVIIDQHDAWLFDRPSVRRTVSEGTLEITVKCGSLTSMLRCRADLRLDAPPDVDVVIQTKSGTVNLRGLRGRAEVETDAGDIDAHRVEPVTFTAKTDAGDIDIDLFGSPARVNVASDAGDVNIVVPYNTYRVDASSDSGNASVHGILRDDLAPRAIMAMTDAGNVRVRAR